MKRSTLFFGIMFMLLACFVVVGDSGASCPDLQFNCYTKNSSKVGPDHVGTCWSWTQIDCLVCHCSGTFDYCNKNYEAEQCNRDFPECKGNCCACYEGGYCYDRDGNRCSINQ